jgi:hypothetical protein
MQCFWKLLQIQYKYIKVSSEISDSWTSIILFKKITLAFIYLQTTTSFNLY